MICSRVLLPPTSKPEDWWIERATPGPCSISTARGKPRALALSPRPMNCPRPDLWLDDVCAPGNPRRKRAEVVRTRTPVSQAHSYSWLGSFGNRGNGRYREELRKGLAASGRYLAAYHLDASRTLRHRSMGNMAMGPCSLTSLGSRLSPAARTIAFLITRCFRRVCTSHLIRSNSGKFARWYAAETSAPRSQWDQRGRSIAWSWRRILRERRKARLG